jgi:1-acyl-sn-glycerol-3-phosphate acyltransferase
VQLVARLRIARRTAGMVGALLLCLPLHYAWKLAGRPSPWPRRFLFLIAFAAGMRAETSGRPLRDKVLFLANHSSWLDIMLLAGASGTAFVSKAEVAEWPVFGWLARLNKTVFVARHRRGDVRGQADALREALKGGAAVALFPEGTTDGGHEILPFRGSLLSALFPPIPGVAVQPVAIDYGEAVHDIAWVGREKAKDNLMRILARKGTTRVRIHFLAPIDPGQAGDRKLLAARSRDEILERLDADSSGLRAGPFGSGADRL